MTQRHPPADITRAVSRFFEVRGLVRTKLARGRKFNPSAWLRVETLKFINDTDAPRAKDIADYLSITAPSATSLVNGLVREGFVVRHIGAHDRRAALLALTPKGKRMLASTLRRGTRVLGTLFVSLSRAELAAFIRMLERILVAGGATLGRSYGPRVEAFTRGKSRTR